MPGDKKRQTLQAEVWEVQSWVQGLQAGIQPAGVCVGERKVSGAEKSGKKGQVCLKKGEKGRESRQKGKR